VIYDLTRTLAEGMPVYPGDPQVRIDMIATPPWQVSALHLGSHSGTHLDAPSHYIAGGRSIDTFPPIASSLREWSSMPADMPQTPR
jgi:arylformamidase